MKRLVMGRLVGLRLRLEILQWRYGGGWLLVAVACALGGVWLIFQRAAADSEEASIQRLSADVSQSERDVNRSASVLADVGEPTAAQVQHERSEALKAVLGDARDVPKALIRLYELAEACQLKVRQAEFAQGRPEAGIGRLQVVMPIKGTYPQLRAFVGEALLAFPHLSVDRLVFKRNQVGQTEVESALYLSFWLHEQDNMALNELTVRTAAQ